MNKKAGMERRSMKDINKIKDINNGDLLAGFSWPPRSYTCSFCRREFRSAQALGGHMNVHRRDRARLRQSPPTPRSDQGHFSSLLNLNLDPKTNPNPSYSPPSSPSSRKFKNFIPTLPPSLLPSSSSAEMGEWTKIEGIPVKHHLVTNYRVKGYNKSSDFEVLDEKAASFSGVVMKKAEIAKLDFKFGFKEDLDLELRLGYT